MYELELIVVANAMEGFEKPVNRGISMATGDWIWILNDDVEFTGWWFIQPVQQAMNDSKVGLVNMTGYDWQGLPSYWNVLVRKEAMDQVGMLDESFPTFSSDHDHAHRIRLAGWKIAHTGKPVTIHHKASSTTKDLPDEQERIRKGKERMQQKWGFS